MYLTKLRNSSINLLKASVMCRKYLGKKTIINQHRKRWRFHKKIASTLLDLNSIYMFELLELLLLL